MSVQLMAGTMSFYADDMLCCIILFAIDYRTSISIAYVIALPAVFLLLMPPNANTWFYQEKSNQLFQALQSWLKVPA